MAAGEKNAVVSAGVTLKDSIIELSKKGLGVVSIIDGDHRLLGVITDGDLRRQLEKGVDVYKLSAHDVMTRTPSVISSGKLAVDALELMRRKNISCLPVMDGEKIVGTIRLQDIIGVGIVG